MTTTEFEAYKAEIANEILSIKRVKVLKAIKGILQEAKPKEVKVKPKAKKTKAGDAVIPTFPPVVLEIEAPCCYTSEEIEKHIADAIESYRQGDYLANEKYRKPALRWTRKACEDSKKIQNYREMKSIRAHSWKFPVLIDSVVEMIVYNPKVGRKEPQLANVISGDIRSLIFDKNNKLFYIEMPDCILVLAIQYSITPFDTKLHKKRK